MDLDEKQTYYDILEVSSDATPQEIRESYLRLKAAYTKDSPALYSLMSREETESLVSQVENAYEVLSTPEKRKEYDRHHGLIEGDDLFEPSGRRPSPAARRPAPEKKSDGFEDDDFEFGEGDDLLDPPSTDFTQEPKQKRQEPSAHVEQPVPRKSRKKKKKEKGRPSPSTRQQPEPRPVAASETDLGAQETSTRSDLEERIKKELDWKGDFIRAVREALAISIEEMADHTKISKRYLKAIEEDHFEELPAAVYLRGFIIQISKKLKLPAETVAAAYIARYRQACPEKS